jgi:hypothetical protein
LVLSAGRPDPGQRDQHWTETWALIDTEIQSQLGQSLSPSFSIVKMLLARFDVVIRARGVLKAS